MAEIAEVIFSSPNLVEYSLSGLIVLCSLFLILNVQRITPDVSYRNIQLSTLVLRSTIVSFSAVILIILWGLGQSFTAKLLAFLAILIPIIARKTLKNTIAGVQIAYLEPYTNDDWIKVDGREGIVEKITLNNTIIQSPDGEEIVIPNSLINQNVIINKSTGGKLKKNIKIKISSDCETKEAKDLIEEVLRETESVLQIPNPQVHIVDIEESNITIGIQYWLEKPHRRQIRRTQDNVLEGIRERFLEESLF